MKISLDITGYYERFTNSGDILQKTSLKSLLRDLHQIASDNRRYCLSSVHQSFGLNFLSMDSLTHLMRHYSDEALLMTDYLLRPLIKDSGGPVSRKFSYRFIPNEWNNFVIDLVPDDPQIPIFISDRQEGNYQLLLEENLGTPVRTYRLEAIRNLEELFHKHPEKVLRLALRSLNLEEFPIDLPNNCTAWLSVSDLPSNLRQDINQIKNQEESPSLSNSLERPLCEYQVQYPTILGYEEIIANLAPAEHIRPSTDIQIGRGIHRNILQDVIKNAQKFLMICSYRLEDPEIIEQITQKSQQIPVWILTDFNNNVQDRVDGTIDELTDSDYINSDLKKKRCLRILNRECIGFRSGNVHLKTYLSEKSAYLGSCNLTGGSLERNGEAGMLWHNTPEHEFLIKYFQHLWSSHTTAKAQPAPQGFQITSFRGEITPSPHHPQFLDQHTFRKDLDKSLRKLSGKKIRIYTRNFNPTPTQFNLLSDQQTRLFYGQYNQCKFRAKKINNLHAKIIIIGREIAYIGSQDFAFGKNSLIDLTYKTTDISEISTIISKVQDLH
ncbi:phospholipase D-like domain-containing protein [Lyngbya confervoides]|uniref:Phospholipase D-like domain-containing protein n=1 Tax=Lyngbya confervoides BDU141951 TaxID=1574623 RepID=A0ABD4T072_9CYAN|nr:phospholipase D-like domain-containing protein [Lyngbya confervoides]MCM1982029.1 phospholipase D-like domain-containing protein [Lyngbya confervoides BDU141951]